MRFYYANEPAHTNIQRNAEGKIVSSLWIVRVFTSKTERDTYVEETLGAMEATAQQVHNCDLLRFVPYGNQLMTHEELVNLRNDIKQGIATLP